MAGGRHVLIENDGAGWDEPGSLLTRQSLSVEEWRVRVAERLADPEGQPFLAAVPVLYVLGGGHTDGPYCWCQPEHEEAHCAAGHRHTRTRHRATMD